MRSNPLCFPGPREESFPVVCLIHRLPPCSAAAARADAVPQRAASQDFYRSGDVEPQLDPVRYTPYGIGLLRIYGGGRWGRVIERAGCVRKLLSFLLLVFFVFPVLGYLLNGGLYSKDKAFILFLPVLCAEVGFMWKPACPGSGSVENRSTGNFKAKVMTELVRMFPYPCSSDSYV